MSTITAKELHLKTKSVLNQLEQGESMLITRNGRAIGRIEPIKGREEQPAWQEIMADVWRAQKGMKRGQRVPNRVLRERERRRR